MAKFHSPNLVPNGRYRVLIGGRAFWCGKDQPTAIRLVKALDVAWEMSNQMARMENWSNRSINSAFKMVGLPSPVADDAQPVESQGLAPVAKAHCPHAALIMQKQTDPKAPDFGCYYGVDEFLAMGNLEGLIANVLAKYPSATDFDSFHDPKGNDTLQVKGARSFKTTLWDNGFCSRARNLKRTRTAELVQRLIAPAG